MNCAYKVQVGTIDPKSSVRVSLSEFEALQQQFHFDAEGKIVDVLDFFAFRLAIQG
jgi:carbon monoxide dehydrogenase subunit G